MPTDPIDLARLAETSPPETRPQVLALVSALGGVRRAVKTRLLVAGQASVEGPVDPVTNREVETLEWLKALIDSAVTLEGQ